MPAFALILLCVCLGAVGQIALKQGMLNIGHLELRFPMMLLTFSRVLVNPLVVVGLGLYGLSALLWLVVLSRVELSYAYPMISLNYVLVIGLSWAIFHERLSWSKLLGTLMICLGVRVLSRHSSTM